MISKTLNFPIQNKHHICWGIDGLSYYGAFYSAIVVVDVLSFCTTVDIAVSKGGSIIPTAIEDEFVLQSLAKKQNAFLAKKRSEPGFTLSPASMKALQPKQRVLLPSLNGSTLIDLASKFEKPVFAGCIRNSQALACFLTQKKYFPILFVVAGERFPNRTLRPSMEDLWGVGSILTALDGDKTVEAKCAAENFEATADHLQEALTECESGQELFKSGYQKDIELAADYNASDCVSILINNQGCLQLSKEDRIFPNPKF